MKHSLLAITLIALMSLTSCNRGKSPVDRGESTDHHKARQGNNSIALNLNQERDAISVAIENATTTSFRIKNIITTGEPSLTPAASLEIRKDGKKIVPCMTPFPAFNEGTPIDLAPSSEVRIERNKSDIAVIYCLEKGTYTGMATITINGMEIRSAPTIINIYQDKQEIDEAIFSQRR